MAKTKGVIERLPMVPLRNMVFFPHMVLFFNVAREASVRAIEAALEGNRRIFLVSQKRLSAVSPKHDDLFGIGVMATVRQIVRTPDGDVRVLVEGLERAQLLSFETVGRYSVCSIQPLSTARARSSKMLTAMIRSARELFDSYRQMHGGLSGENAIALMDTKEAGVLCDMMAANSFFQIEDKQMILEELEEKSRLSLLMQILERELELSMLEGSIMERVRHTLSQEQKEYFLRSQIRVLQKELGDDQQQEEDDYRDRIGKLPIADKYKEKLEKELQRLSRTAPHSPDNGVIKSYLDTVLDLPWNKMSKTITDLKEAERILNRDHYGMDKVKERILEYLAVRSLTDGKSSNVLCLVGPPGVGKTSIVRSIAEAMGREYCRMSLGGIRDEAEIRGHRKTYIGAMPGRIINAIKTAGTKNPVILLDEIDKLSGDFRGDPSSALLEVLDGEQNHSFTDHYIEIPFDLRDVFFITTANQLDTIQKPLLDRMEVIHLSGYTLQEKQMIASKYLVPKQRKLNGVSSGQLVISKKIIGIMIESYTRESGVRELERLIGSVCRKSAKALYDAPDTKITVTVERLREYLGKPRYHRSDAELMPQVGVANGLAWTAVGGELLPIEVSVLEGTGKLEITGRLGDVMKESAKAAYSYVRSIMPQYTEDAEYYKKKDIHIHVPDGATPKDGPSAGITLTVSLLSALTSIPVRGDLAMTGEVTVRGRVLPIGGVKEKVLAAHRAGIKQVILPKENEADLEEIPKDIREEMCFTTVSHVSEVLKKALLSGEGKA